MNYIKKTNSFFYFHFLDFYSKLAKRKKSAHKTMESFHQGLKQ